MASPKSNPTGKAQAAKTASKAAKRARPRKTAAARTAADEPTGPMPEANQPGHRSEPIPDKPSEPPEPYRQTTTFPFRFERLMVPLSAAVGVLPQTAHVDVDGVELRIRFGAWSLTTPLDNISGTDVTGPYQFVKVAGPPRISLADRGVTFATNRQRGLCIRFREPVAAALPFGLIHHPAATVTVEDLEGLASAVAGS